MEDGPAIGYNRRLRVLTQLSFFLPMGMLYAFEKLDLSLPASRYSLHFSNNYYGALLLYWSAVHLTMTLVLAVVNAASYNLERHYKLTRQSYGSWLGDYLKRRLINWLVTSIGLVWFYSAVRSSSERWFLLFWPAIVLFYGGTLLLFDSLLLPLFYKVVPLGSGEVSDRLSLLAARAGISKPKFAILQVGRKPRAPMRS
jgi:CAAX prenyl protease N-terminal, five membrane helices